MQTTEFLTERPATAADLLERLRDDYRHRAATDPEVDRGATLTAATTVAEWRLICDLVGTRRLGGTLDGLFGTRLGNAGWRRLLEPERERTLGALCAATAPDVRVPVVRPFRVAGAECVSAGAFLTLRTLLARAGVDVGGVRPSTRLATYARAHTLEVMRAAGALAPGALPPPLVRRTRLERIALHLFWLILAVPLAGGLLRNPVLASTGAILGLAVAYAVNAAIHAARPADISFGELATFGDLTRCVTAASAPDV
jgi:hypothetical protein